MPAEPAIEHEIRVELAARGWDAAIGALADRQHGPVARRQLVEMGLKRGAISWRLRTKRLHVVHNGVYVPGRRRLTRQGLWMAAVLACGPGAVLSHRSAAALWGIRDRDGGAPIDVIAARRVRRQAGIAARVTHVPRDERTVIDVIPVTTVPRTLLDLAAVLSVEPLRRVLEQAEALRLGDPLPLRALLERHQGCRGVARLRAVLEEGPLRPAVLRSALERRFVDLVRAAGLPPPETNVWLEVGGASIEVDCLWSAERVAVELDGRAYHGGSEAYERDRARDRRLQAAGWRVIRVTWMALEREPDRVAADLAALLAPTTRRRHATP